MEKISFKPLIDELRSNSLIFNRITDNATMRFGNLDAKTISKWMVEVVQPLAEVLYKLNLDPEKNHSIVKTLYFKSLNLIGSGSIPRYFSDYKYAWLILIKVPKLLVKSPSKIITLINEAVLKLNEFEPENTLLWSDLMNCVTLEIENLEEFKIAGRICAWKCGLAHLRCRLKSDFEKLKINLKQKINQELFPQQDLLYIIDNQWIKNDINFKTSIGGFFGLNGYFENPPVLDLIENQIFLLDNEKSYALFADEFGTVLLETEFEVAKNLKLNKDFLIKENINWKEINPKIDLENISSCIRTKNILAFTFYNSFYSFIYSYPNA